MERKMRDGRIIGKFYSVPCFWMIIVAVYDAEDPGQYVMERHVIWNRDTSKEVSCSMSLDDRLLPKSVFLGEGLLVTEIRAAVDVMKHEWRDQFMPGEKDTIKFHIDDLNKSAGPDINWYLLSDARFFKGAWREIAGRTRCRQLKEHLEKVLQ